MFEAALRAVLEALLSPHRGCIGASLRPRSGRAGVLFEARERNISVPEDVSVVGFDDTPLAQRIWPPLTTVRQPIHQMVRSAVDRLIKTVGGVSIDDGPTRFSCDVVVRQSTRGR